MTPGSKLLDSANASV